MKNSPHPQHRATTIGQRSTVRLLLILSGLSAALFLSVLVLTISSQQKFQKLSEQVHAPVTLDVTIPDNMTSYIKAEIQAPAETESIAGTAQETMPALPSETLPTILPQYQSLYAENPDFIGWLYIPDTKIDYPVMHTPSDPEKYLHADFDGQYSFGGTPFLDAYCTLDSDNLIVYGHNMLNGGMFHPLLRYQEKNYWQSHPIICFTTLYEDREYEVLAAFYDRIYYKTDTCFKFYQFIDAADTTEFDSAIQYFREKSLYETGVTVEHGDKLITLVTCSSYVENGRFVVVARLISD